jgi:hypothetical protein
MSRWSSALVATLALGGAASAFALGEAPFVAFTPSAARL